jgi:hypothetical protein
MLGFRNESGGCSFIPDAPDVNLSNTNGEIFIRMGKKEPLTGDTVSGEFPIADLERFVADIHVAIFNKVQDGTFTAHETLYWMGKLKDLAIMLGFSLNCPEATLVYWG